jgi:sugar phosphate isomerase/epimerase
MKPLALQMFTVREMAEVDLAGTLRKVAQIGYAAVEFAGLYGHKPAEVRKMLDDAGLKACAAHVKLLPGKTTLEAEVEAAKTLGYELLVIPFAPAERFVDRPHIEVLAADLRTWAEKVKRHGLRLAYHNHTQEMAVVDGRYALEWLHDLATGVESQVNIYLTANFGAVDVPAFIERHKSRITSLHICDGLLVDRTQVPVGQGKMDIAACVKATSPRVLQWLIVENEDCLGDPLEAARISCEYMVSNGLATGRS